MIEHLSKVSDLIMKIKKFFGDNGFQFNEITEVNKGGQRFLRITMSIKLNDKEK